MPASGKLSSSDLQFATIFRRTGVLQDIDTHRIDHSRGAIIVSCSDGDQIHDLFHHHEQIVKEKNQSPRLHTFALNGGALLLPVGSPLNQPFKEDEVLLRHIAVGRRIKEINTVILYTHAPCAAAKMHNLSFLTVLELLIRAKTLLKSIDATVKVACFCHIDYGDGKKRTYFVSREAFNKLLPRSMALRIR